MVPRTLGQQLAPKKVHDVGTSVSTLHGRDATWPSLARWTKDEPQEFLIITFK